MAGTRMLSESEPTPVIAISSASSRQGVGARVAVGGSCVGSGNGWSARFSRAPSGRVAAASQARGRGIDAAATSVSRDARVVARRASAISSAVSSRGSISRRSIGASVSVSNALSGFSAPATGGAFDHQHQVLDADAVGAGLVVAGLVRQDHAALERRGAELGDARRAFVHRQIAADAVAGAVVEIEPGLPTATGARTNRAARRWCRRETPRARSRCGP